MKREEPARIEIPEILPKRILGWYDQGHRILPWRENPKPYYVWVSEIMLQQTRVEAVKPYFDRFVLALPTIRDLAEADEALLMKLWEGLGYYRRVRNLQAAARVIMEEFGGEMPASYPLLRSLPGIGEYTAGAIASIAFGLPTPAVDGNVLRVISRVCEDYRDILKQSVKREIAEELKTLYPKGRCGDFTQSLMELGATVCVPNGTPHCEECPLSDLCLAHLNHVADVIPVKAPKKPRKIQKKTVFFLEHQGKIAIRKRKEDGLLAGLWEFPNAEGALSPQEETAVLKEMGIEANHLERVGSAVHVFTHVEWQMQIVKGSCRLQNATDFRWVTKEELLEEVTLPTAFKKIIKKVLD